MGLLTQLGEECCHYYTQDFPSAIMKEAEISLIDFLASLLYGTQSKYYRILANYVESVEEGGESLFGFNSKTTAEEEVFIHAVLGHAMEIDDIHLGTAGFHPGVTIIPAVLVKGKEVNASGNQILKSIIIGYEVAGRIGKALSPSHRYQGFHATGTIGVFGAAAACAFLEGLSSEKFANALAIAASQAGGTFSFLAGAVDVKYLHAGNSAVTGLKSVRLAKSGFEGPSETLEHESGFAKAYSQKSDLSSISKPFGSIFEIENLFRKQYFFCGHIFSAIDAINGFGEIQIDSIKEINVYTYKAASVLRNKSPQTIEEAKFSIPYIVSSFLCYGKLENAFQKPHLLEKLQSVLELVHVHHEEEYTSCFPVWRKTKVTLTFKDNTQKTHLIEMPKGSPVNPLSNKEIIKKFIDASSIIENEEIVEQLYKKIFSIRELDTVHDLLHLLYQIKVLEIHE